MSARHARQNRSRARSAYQFCGETNDRSFVCRRARRERVFFSSCGSNVQIARVLSLIYRRSTWSKSRGNRKKSFFFYFD